MIDLKSNDDSINNIMIKLKRIIQSGIANEDYELSLEAIFAYSYIQYKRNSCYRDKEIEIALKRISEQKIEKPYLPDDNTIMMYDETGYDIRGLTLIYLKGLCESGYKVVYVTRETARNHQPLHKEIIKKYSVDVEYIDFSNTYMSQINDLSEVIKKYRPKIAVAHSNAFDPVWPIVFNRFSRCMDRFIINLTDHGFWIGMDSVDYVLEFRNYGASVTHYYRNVDKSKQILLPYYPLINNELPSKGLPFDSSRRFIFSGGSLYKTIDKEKTYYRIIRHLLHNFTDIVFFYVGNGDTYDIDQLMLEFPERVFYEKERDDFCMIMSKCTLYINTFPVVGGLMTQYAATFGKVPLTINHGSRASGLLLDDNCYAFCSTVDELLDKATHLLKDDFELHRQSEVMKKMVITPERFVEQLKKAMINKKTDFVKEYFTIDTHQIREEHRYSYDSASIRRGIARKNHFKLIKYFPMLFLERYIMSLVRKY